MHLWKRCLLPLFSRFCKKCPRQAGRQAGASQHPNHCIRRCLWGQQLPKGAGSLEGGHWAEGPWGLGHAQGQGFGAEGAYLNFGVYAISYNGLDFKGKKSAEMTHNIVAIYTGKGSKWRFYNSLIWFIGTLISRIINDKIKILFFSFKIINFLCLSGHSVPQLIQGCPTIS